MKINFSSFSKISCVTGIKLCALSIGILFSLSVYADNEHIKPFQKAASVAYERMVQAKNAAENASKDAAFAKRNFESLKQKLATAEQEYLSAEKKLEQAQQSLRTASQQWQQASDTLAQEWKNATVSP